MIKLMYIDLLIKDGDFVFNIGNELILCNNWMSIGQDCVYVIIESGFII